MCALFQTVMNVKSAFVVICEQIILMEGPKDSTNEMLELIRILVTIVGQPIPSPPLCKAPQPQTATRRRKSDDHDCFYVHHRTHHGHDTTECKVVLDQAKKIQGQVDIVFEKTRKFIQKHSMFLRK